MTRLSTQEILWRSIAEAALQEKLRDLAKQTGALYFHDRDSRKNPKGWPDTALIMPGSTTLWVPELKKELGVLKPEQVQWGEALVLCQRVEYRVMRPSNSDEIVEEIVATRGR
jgi:hypothetical protein